MDANYNLPPGCTQRDIDVASGCPTQPPNCVNCRGEGVVLNEDQEEINCPQCDGLGYIE